MSGLSELLVIVGQWRRAYESQKRAEMAWRAAKPRTRERRANWARFCFYMRERADLEGTLLRMAKREAQAIEAFEDTWSLELKRKLGWK